MANENPFDETVPRLLTRQSLVEAVAKTVGLPRREAAHVMELIFDSIVRALRSGDKVEIRGFGSFHTRQRLGRIGRNPKTGVRVVVPPKKIPYFKPSASIKQKLNTKT